MARAIHQVGSVAGAGQFLYYRNGFAASVCAGNPPGARSIR